MCVCAPRGLVDRAVYTAAHASQFVAAPRRANTKARACTRQTRPSFPTRHQAHAAVAATCTVGASAVFSFDQFGRTPTLTPAILEIILLLHASEKEELRSFPRNRLWPRMACTAKRRGECERHTEVCAGIPGGISGGSVTPIYSICSQPPDGQGGCAAPPSRRLRRRSAKLRPGAQMTGGAYNL